MPRGGLDVEYRLLDVVQHSEVLVEDRFDLDESSEDLGTSLTGKVRHLRLVALLTPGEVHLTLAHLQGDTETSVTGTNNVLLSATRSHPEMVGNMSHVTLNFDPSKIPFLHF